MKTCGVNVAGNSDISYLMVLVTVVICLFAGPISQRLGVVDMPDGDRKAHPEPTPMVGGIAIMLPLCLWCIIQYFRPGDANDLYPAIAICGGGLAVIGFMDDQQTISAGARLILLALLSAVALKLDPALFTNHVHTVAYGWSSAPYGVIPVLTVVALMGFSSAVNMADGMNGLVVALYLIWGFCLTLLGTGPVQGAAQLIAGAAFITFMFNLRGRLFLGDCGTFAIGFVVGLLAILCHNAGTLPLETVIVWFFLPVADCFRLIAVRAYQHRSPFRPDKSHFHHQLAKWIGESGAFWTYAGVVMVTSLTATLDPHMADVCIAVLAVFYVGFQVTDLLAPARAVDAVAEDVSTEERPSATILPLNRNKPQ
jgi:UDP-GlcNAc:undecaprenyl-phosphate GlcNAc-1-phosphate transferase